MQHPCELSLNRPVDDLFAIALARPQGSGPETRPELVVADARHRGGEGVRVSRRNQDPIDARLDDLRDAADRGGDHGRLGGQRLDGGVREVLPVARQDRRVRGTHALDRLGSRQGPDQRDPITHASLVDGPNQVGPGGTLADDHERGACDPAQRGDRERQVLLRGESPREDEGREREAEPVAKLLPRGGPVDRRSRIGHHPNPLRWRAPAVGDLGEVAAGDDDPLGALDDPFARRLEQRQAAARMRRLELLEGAGKQTQAHGPLVGRIVDELEYERNAAERGSERAAAVEARRVDDVDSSRGDEDRQRGRRLADELMPVLARCADREAGRLRAAGARRGDGPNAVAAIGEEAAELRPVRGRTADLRRPDPGRNQDAHCVPSSLGPCPLIPATRLPVPTCGP